MERGPAWLPFGRVRPVRDAPGPLSFDRLRMSGMRTAVRPFDRAQASLTVRGSNRAGRSPFETRCALLRTNGSERA